MRDYTKGRNGLTGFDRVLAATAATFIALATNGAQAQTTKSVTDLAVDAAMPRPDAVDVTPPTAADIKLDAATAAAAPVIATPAPAAPAVAATPAPATPPVAAAPAETPKATSTAASVDPSTSDKLRELIATKGAKYFDRKNERTAVENFYKDRNYGPLWTDASGTINARARAVMARLKDAASEGLNAGDYPLPEFAIATTPETVSDAELRLTESMLDYARHAQSGRMHWSRVSADIAYPEHPVDPVEVLINVSTAKDAAAALAGYNPQHKGYQALKTKLAELRGTTEAAGSQIAEGETLKFAKAPKKGPAPAVMEDSRVPAIRAKLNVENADDAHYDAKVSEAVRKFQASNDLKPTGMLDNATIRVMNGPKSDRQIDIVRVNMERWRWLPRELGAQSLGNAYVILNIPDYTLKVMHNGSQAWTTRVVTGKPGTHATPLLTETMKFITVNPTWNVPPSIIYNEYLPALQQDPQVLERMGLKLSRAQDGSVRISQPPGAANALGRIRFNFPNKFLVYQHDTPDKHLFAKEERAFSHGCMRVQNPDQYAEALLKIALPKDNYTADKIKGMYGNSEININFPTPIPVNITYQTAFVDDAGKLEFRKDVYGRDAKMIPMIKGSEGKELEVAVSHSQPNYVRPTNVNIPGDSYASNGPSFFQRLFGAPTPPPAPVRARRQSARQ